MFHIFLYYYQWYVFKFSFYNWCLLAYKNATCFSILVFYLGNLLNSINSKNIFYILLGLLYRHSSHLWIVSFITYLPILTWFLFFGFFFFFFAYYWLAPVQWSIELVVSITDKLPFSMGILELSSNIKNKVLEATKMSFSMWMAK